MAAHGTGRSGQMTEEVKANLSFGPYRLGQRIQVDVDDPAVAGLIKAGYLTILRKEPGSAAVDDPDGLSRVPGVGVDSGVEQGTPPKRGRGRPRKKVADGPGEPGQGEGVVDSPTVRDASGGEDD